MPYADLDVRREFHKLYRRRYRATQRAARITSAEEFSFALHQLVSAYERMANVMSATLPQAERRRLGDLLSGVRQYTSASAEPMRALKVLAGRIKPLTTEDAS